MRCLTFIILASALFISGCKSTGHTTSVSTDIESDPQSSFAHHTPVLSKVDGAYYQAMPQCVTVLPVASGRLNGDGSQRLEQAVALRMHEKFQRVIGPRDRAAIARSAGVDETAEVDLGAFIDALGCRNFIRITPHGKTGRHFGGFWTEITASLMLELVELDGEGNERVLWQSRGSRRRGDGGLPLSILSAAGSAIRAGQLASDPEAMDSVTDDVLRAMVRKLPDLQHATVSTQYYRRQ